MVVARGRQGLRPQQLGQSTTCGPRASDAAALHARATPSRLNFCGTTHSSHHHRFRSQSAPPLSIAPSSDMLSASTLDLTFDDEEDFRPPRLYRAASVVNSYAVTSIGRGVAWDETDASHMNGDGGYRNAKENTGLFFDTPSESKLFFSSDSSDRLQDSPRILQEVMRPVTNSFLPVVTNEQFVYSPPTSRPTSPLNSVLPSHTPPMSRSPTQPPRPRRRSSQQRVSLIAGRVSIATIEPPSPVLPHNLLRSGSTSSLLSQAASTRAPSPVISDSLGDRSISDFVIEAEIGRGAYGLVKRARPKMPDGGLGPPIIIKQIIKSRILADCWKKHPKHGTIPIEIYVMSSISHTSYVLPAKRPWDPLRNAIYESDNTPTISPPTLSNDGETGPAEAGPSSISRAAAELPWVEGAVVNGHPNICALLEFFEDNHYYYIVLPFLAPEPAEGLLGPSSEALRAFSDVASSIPAGPSHPTPGDLFDLVEIFPNGLPANAVRTYLGQLADALAFLHDRGIVHRDVKDENVVLGPDGRCILIDFGSSGLVKRGGWDTFSGTLDYAGPEILRGERYEGKPQDVWAFGVVAYVLLVGECPFMTPAEAQDGIESPFASAAMALDERCNPDDENDPCGKAREVIEADGGGALEDGAALVRACLQVEVDKRPSFERIMQCRFLAGDVEGAWV
ncbi:unnamed protein product [Mycena citricolor]|uniref:Protein kinase domain-containing protein n=1 Tax=Mycena citricolor TaxID=2018698 RepID=A0AAD2Q6S3_9AGAR|nr:unnamed protein product [Mycena citricolor]